MKAWSKAASLQERRRDDQDSGEKWNKQTNQFNLRLRGTVILFSVKAWVVGLSSLQSLKKKIKNLWQSKLANIYIHKTDYNNKQKLRDNCSVLETIIYEEKEKSENKTFMFYVLGQQMHILL